MLVETTKLRLIFLVALAIGSIGAVGQAFMLHHELVDCYPYKMMSFPPADFYKSIASVGIYFAPIIAIAGGLLLSLKRWWLASVVPVVLCPLLFVGVYKTASVVREWSGVVDLGRNFDGTLPETVAQDFFSFAAWLSIEGLIVGAICGFLLTRFLAAKKLA